VGEGIGGAAGFLVQGLAASLGKERKNWTVRRPFRGGSPRGRGKSVSTGIRLPLRGFLNLSRYLDAYVRKMEEEVLDGEGGDSSYYLIRRGG